MDSSEEGQVPPGADALDRAWLERATAGDQEAFERLFKRYERAVHGVLVAAVPYQEVADLQQDVFTQALDALQRLGAPTAPGAWLCTIARNRARDFLKSARRSHEVPLTEEVVLGAGMGDEPEQRELVGRILKVLRDLPAPYHESLALRLIEGLSGPDIARAQGRTHGAVRVNLCRGMRLFRERLSELGLEGGAL